MFRVPSLFLAHGPHSLDSFVRSMQWVRRVWVPLLGSLMPALAISAAPSPTAPAVAAASAAPSATTCPTVLQHRFLRLQDEQPQDLCQYAGKVVLVVNTASFCGFTEQYKGLEALYTRLRDRGLVVLGFPSNDFGAQEPGSNASIASFCENTYGVKFPMFTKSQVVAKAGPALNPLYAQLNTLTGQAPRWNFHKYLISRDGARVRSFASDVDPTNAAFVAAVEQQLSATR